MAERLLRGDVIGRSEDAAALRQSDIGATARDAEVRQLGAAVRSEQDVLSLDVAMHDAALVRRGQRSCHLDRVGDGLVHRQAPDAPKALLQRLARDVLEHDERCSRLLTDVDHGDDVRMTELCQRAGLASKALQLVGLAGETLGQDLDRYAPLKHCVEGDPYGGAAAAAERPLEAVATSQRSAGRWVGVGIRNVAVIGRSHQDIAVWPSTPRRAACRCEAPTAGGAGLPCAVACCVGRNVLRGARGWWRELAAR